MRADLQMHISRVSVHHFRCLRFCEIELANFTALVGPNGVGKSTFLEAIRFFFQPKYELTKEDINPNCHAAPLSVMVVFRGLSAGEAEEYGPLLVDGELGITKTSTFDEESESWSSRYEVSDYQHPAFDEIRNAGGAVAVRATYSAFAQKHPPYRLEPITTGAAAEASMRAWELQNTTQCTRRPRLFEFTSGGETSIATSTQLVYIPAVRDVRAELEGARSPLQELLQSVVFSEIENKPEFIDLRRRFEEEYLSLFPETNVPELDALATSVSSYLSSFAPGSRINLGWKQDAIPDISAPDVRATIVEDDFEGDVSRKGHGVQRAVIVALVRALSLHRDSAIATSSSTAGPARATNLLLVIEEPELYQHPTRARHFSAALRSLSSTNSDTQNTQVIISTHSPYFVSIAHFEAVRLLRRNYSGNLAVPERTIGRTTLEEVAQEIGQSLDPPKPLVGELLRARIHGILDNALREGFFADSIVLVEGDNDQAFVAALCEQHSFDYEAAGLAILPVNGKTSLDKALVIFRKLGIPTYVMFDADSTKEIDLSANVSLLKLLGQEGLEKPPSLVHATFTVHHDNLEEMLMSEFGDAYVQTLQQVATEFGYQAYKRAQKVPLIVAETLKRLSAARHRSEYFERLFSCIQTIAVENRQAKMVKCP